MYLVPFLLKLYSNSDRKNEFLGDFDEKKRTQFPTEEKVNKCIAYERNLELLPVIYTSTLLRRKRPFRIP